MFEPLERAGYEDRRSQKAMAEKVKEVMDTKKKVVLLEAPTGTGKTFAYLVPAILSGKRVLVSTYTRLLQEQLLSDVKELSRIYGKEVSAGVWKGVSSYICLLKLEEDYDPEIGEEAFRCRGDIFRMSVPASRLKKYIVEDRDECEGCAREDCFYRLAKMSALRSQITIVNHHVIASFPSLLEHYELVVLDEGHEFPEVLIEAQTVSFSEKTIKEFLPVDKVDEKGLPEIYERLKEERVRVREATSEVIRKLLLVMGDEYTINWQSLFGIKKYAGFLPDEDSLVVSDQYSELDREIWKAIKVSRKLEKLLSKIKDYLNGRRGFERVTEEGKFRTFKLVPLFADLKAVLGEFHPPVVFVSATLDRDYMKTMLSLKENDFEYISFPSEWSYNLEIKVVDVSPHEEEWERALIETVVVARKEFEKVIVLLTNKEHLKLVDTPLKQGEMAMKIMVERFKEEGGVLAGADTFWKGIDIPGRKALVIGKLPFRNPDDVIHKKRCEFLENYYGKEVMWKYIKGVAMMNLKQGIGRLKRGREDTGTIYLVDNRVMKGFFRDFLSLLSSYGTVRFSSLATKSAIAEV